MERTDVVVGIDGSEPSRAALRWAAAEARRRGASLRVLLAYHQRVQGMRYTESGELEQAVREHAEKTVDQAVEEARGLAPEVTVRGDVILGRPARVLIDLSGDAGLMVVGSRGLGGFDGLLLGSVGAQVAEHAHSPVVVVRGRSNATGGPVVVGVDGSPFSDEALGQAFQEASWRGCALLARTAYTLPLPTRTADITMLTREREAAEATLRDELERMVTGWRATYPDVTVDSDISVGRAIDVLTDLSRQAQLVVVGTRGQGGFIGLLLGSVSQQLVHHADCPVLIAR